MNRRYWILGALYLILGALFLWPRNPSPASMSCSAGGTTYSNCGAALLSGADPQSSASYHMPGFSLLGYLLRERAGETGRQVWSAGIKIATAVMVFLLASQFGPVAWAAIAAAFWFVADYRAVSCYPQAEFTPIVLLCAFAWINYCRKPSVEGALCVGAAAGLSLLLRSTLVFLPPVLAFLSWRWKLGKKGVWRERSVLGMMPYLFLAPWIAMNALAYGEWVLLERGQANQNLVTGALGSVGTIEGDLAALPGAPEKFESTQAAALWAAGEYAKHPLRSLSAVIQRVGFVMGLDAALWLLACAGLFWSRRDKLWRAQWAVIAYYVAVHCLMSVERDYLAPLKPLLAVAAAYPALMLWPAAKRAAARPSRRGPKWARSIAWGCAGLSALILTPVSVFGWRAIARPPDSALALEQAIGRKDPSGWLRWQRGLRALKRGEISAAVADLRAAVDRHPADLERRLGLGWGLLAAAGEERIGFAEAADGDNPGLEIDRFLYEAEVSLQAGEASRADALLDSARRRWRARYVKLRRIRTQFDHALLDRLQSPGVGHVYLLRRIQRYRAGGFPSLTAVRIAERSLEEFPGDSESLRRVVIALQAVESYGMAEKMLTRLIRRKEDAALLHDRAVVRFLAGNKEGAVEDLKASLEFQSAYQQAYITLSYVLFAEGRLGEAKKVCQEGLAEAAGSQYEGPLRSQCLIGNPPQ